MKNFLSILIVGILNCEIFIKVIVMYDRKFYLGGLYLYLLDFCCGFLIKMISINFIGYVIKKLMYLYF